MHLGIVSYNTAYGIRPDDCAREAAARGFEVARDGWRGTVRRSVRLNRIGSPRAWPTA